MPDRGPAPPLTLLCFDFGLKRTGVAVGQSLTRTATPLEVLSGDPAERQLRRIEQLINQWQPDALVVGVPLTEDGGSQAMTRHARRFAARLQQRFGLEVHEADERLSSRAAQSRFRTQRAAGGARRSQAGREDAVAAQIILEDWFADIDSRHQ